MNCTRLAALLTCHNRKLKTLASLKALFNQNLPPALSIDVFLVDDGSTDGTALSVSEAYSQVKILQGDGSLFWNGGMRLALTEAIKYDYDYYLWLNDDTILYQNALTSLLATIHDLQAPGQQKVLVVGSTCDPHTQALTYGGVVRRSRWRPLKYDLVEPGEAVKPCDTINGNCVLISREVIQVVGNLDPAFTHYAGDWDYGLRAKKQGCMICIAPGYVGTCAQNYQPNSDSKINAPVPLGEGIKKITQPKGLALREQVLPPFWEWKIFAQRYGGILWSIYWLLSYRRLLWVSWFKKSKKT